MTRSRTLSPGSRRSVSSFRPKLPSEDFMSDLSRRQTFLRIAAMFNGAVGVVLGIPIVRYLLSPVTRERTAGYDQWISLGSVSRFPSGETRLATYRNPSASPSDGETAEIPCWVRNVDGDKFQVF